VHREQKRAVLTYNISIGYILKAECVCVY
jgi:hypothetical protein